MKKIRGIAFFLFALVFLFSTLMYARHLRHSAVSDASHSLARELAVSAEAAPQTEPPLPAEDSGKLWTPAPVSEDPYLDTLRGLDLQALRQINPDVIGWILLPGTPIDYPIVFGQDNDFYLEHTWDRKPSDSGSIFLECLNRPDMTEFHTLLYGHNMKNRSMFASLRDYRTEEDLLARPHVYLLTQTGVFRYEIYSAYQAKVDSSTYLVGMQQDQTRQHYIDYTLRQSAFDSGILPGVNDRILTLSTCSGMGHTTRWVVHARLPMVEVSQ